MDIRQLRSGMGVRQMPFDPEDENPALKVSG
jgi:hypothetical protein